MKKGTIAVIVIIAVLAIAAFFVIRWILKVKCDPEKPGFDIDGNINQKCGVPFQGGGYGNGQGSGTGGTGTGTGTGTGGTGTGPYNPPVVKKKIEDYIGHSLYANRNGINLLYNDDLKVAKTYNKDEYIGTLGKEATGYWFCPDRKGFYKIWDTSTGKGVPDCDYIMSDSNLKSILGIA